MSEMRQSLASLTDAVLRNNAGNRPPREDNTLTQDSSCRGRDPQLGSSASSISIAPIQAVRNMNSWITGQRPDGRQDLPVSSTTNPATAIDEKYLEV
jgi:hypothetical protein